MIITTRTFIPQYLQVTHLTIASAIFIVYLQYKERSLNDFKDRKLKSR